MASGDELVKIITEKVVHFVETPKEVRRQEQRNQREPWTRKWFGMIPLAIEMWWGSRPDPLRKERRRKNSSHEF
ncbi:YqzE family protein [Paenibacillus sp. YPG26]|uniref:YqzE family protein n=1 Tax=Paenibacillus sp. YPG26 TaxID=2878915 RepID=UPI00203EFF9F|nr:YqzE family protein [Paenibacillus sp. YPG26]USB32200.1 YqzE family protein [Paenibacillus sp. YPG26]